MVNGPESYETLKDSFSELFEQINNLNNLNNDGKVQFNHKQILV